MAEVIYSNLLKKAGVKHGFSKRGDQAVGKFGGHNVKSDHGTPDDPEAAAKNRQQIYRKVGVEPDEAVFLRKLAHGNTIFEAHSSDGGSEIDGYDSIVTGEPITIGLSVADCVAVLLYEPNTNVAAVVHAGWRGTMAGATSEMIKTLKRKYKIDPKNIRAVVGPSICGQCYEVGEDVAKLFDEEFVTNDRSHWTVDIRANNIAQLKINGVVKIEDIDLCTYEQPDQFFSARRDGQTGRFLAFIRPTIK